MTSFLRWLLPVGSASKLLSVAAILAGQLRFADQCNREYAAVLRAAIDRCLARLLSLAHADLCPGSLESKLSRLAVCKTLASKLGHKPTCTLPAAFLHRSWHAGPI